MVASGFPATFDCKTRSRLIKNITCNLYLLHHERVQKMNLTLVLGGGGQMYLSHVFYEKKTRIEGGGLQRTFRADHTIKQFMPSLKISWAINPMTSDLFLTQCHNSDLKYRRFVPTVSSAIILKRHDQGRKSSWTCKVFSFKVQTCLATVQCSSVLRTSLSGKFVLALPLALVLAIAKLGAGQLKGVQPTRARVDRRGEAESINAYLRLPVL